MEFINELYCNVTHYFDTLSKLGYYKYTDVYKLLIYLFIEQEFLDGQYEYFVTEDDYDTILKALNCIWGTSCLTPYLSWRQGIQNEDGAIYNKWNNGEYRITEDRILRSPEESDSLRVTEESNN
jgi:hypothetical protein